MFNPVTVEDQNTVFRLRTRYTGVLAGIEPVDPHILRNSRSQVTRCTNDQRHWSTWGAYTPDSVLFGGQNTVVRFPTSHTGFLAGMRPVDSRVFGKTGLRTVRCTNDHRHQNPWGEYILDPVTVEDQNAVFRFPTSHTGFLAGIEPVNPHILRIPRSRGVRCTNDQRHRNTWGAYVPDSVLFEGQNAVFSTPQVLSKVFR